MTIRDRMLLFYTYEDDRDMKFTDKDWFRFRYKIDPNSPNAEKCRDMMMYYIETNGWHRVLKPPTFALLLTVLPVHK